MPQWAKNLDHFKLKHFEPNLLRNKQGIVKQYRVSTTPGNPGNLLEFKSPPGNPGNLLEFNGPPGNFCVR